MSSVFLDIMRSNLLDTMRSDLLDTMRSDLLDIMKMFFLDTMRSDLLDTMRCDLLNFMRSNFVRVVGHGRICQIWWDSPDTMGFYRTIMEFPRHDEIHWKRQDLQLKIETRFAGHNEVIIFAEHGEICWFKTTRSTIHHEICHTHHQICGTGHFFYSLSIIKLFWHHSFGFTVIYTYNVY